MASCCPVVAARSGGIPDIVTDGVNGYLFDPQADIQEAINATVNLLKQRQEINIIRKNARAEAEKWGWSSATKQLQDYYQKIVFNHEKFNS
jgi:glycosyltransferase involved in cell wall biosynthesis